MHTFGRREVKVKPRILIVASTKGGVGKTTVALGIASALCRMEKKVLLCDLDFENKCLDMFMGLEDVSLYNIADVARGFVTAEIAVVSNNRGLSFISAPVGVRLAGESGEDSISDSDLVKALKSAIDVKDVDFVILDTPAGHTVTDAVAKAFPNAEGITVASHQPASMKGAENASRILISHGIENNRLVITGFEPESATRDVRAGVIEIIDSSRVRMIGVVPYDRSLMLSHEKGVMAPASCPANKAFSNIAGRICGEEIPLFTGLNIKKIRVL